MYFSSLPRITVDAGVCAGKACVRGLRFPASRLLRLLASGQSRDAILARYPYLEVENIDEALQYAAMLADHRHGPSWGLAIRNGDDHVTISVMAYQRMILRLLSTMAVFTSVGAASAASPAGHDILEHEQIGALKIGDPDSSIQKAVDCRLARTEPTTSATVSREGRRLYGPLTYHVEWRNIPCGIRVATAGPGDRGKSITEIHVFEPGKLVTTRNIKVGSTEQDVIKAYEADWNKDASEPGKAIVAGAVDRGIIFYLDKGRVIKILFRKVL